MASSAGDSISEKDVEAQPENPSGIETSKDAGSAERDPNIVDWDGPNDPENPMNWKQSKKITSIGIISFMTLLSPLSSTIISPATAAVMQTFHSTNKTLGAFVTSVYLLGYVFGPLALAPLSELYGRLIIYNVCNVLFVVFTVACAVANSEASLIVFRVLAGITASSPVTLGAGSIADMIPFQKRGLAMALWMLGPILGPTVGPLGGSYLAAAKGWRWVFWLLAIVGGAAAVLTAVFMRESNAYVILERRTKRLRKETGNPNLRSALDTGKDPKEYFRTSIVRPIRMLCLAPIVLLVSIMMAVTYAYLYLLFTTFPRIFIGQYGFNERNVGLTYLGVGVGAFVGIFTMGAVSDKIVTALAQRNGGKHKPEFRLPAMMVGAFLIPIGLFIYGWSAEKKVQWMVPIIGTGFLGCGMMFSFMPGMTYLVDIYTQYAASVAAASTVLRSLLGALLPLVGDSMYNSLGVGWGTSLLGFISVAFIPVMFILWQYGERIRNSKISRVEF